MMTPRPRALRLLSRLRNDTSALALLEFAFTLPIILAMGGYGIEISNLALANLNISQYALTLADNASRVGVDSGLSTFQLREADINDVLQGIKLESKNFKVTTYGRITLSSFEWIKQSYDAAPVKRIHWQRCIGLKSGVGYDSTFGVVSPSAGSDATAGNAGIVSTGMGDPSVTPPSGAGMMFVEINFDYQPLFKTMFVAPTKIHYTASFIVRDKRDYSQIFNPNPPATSAKCNIYSA